MELTSDEFKRIFSKSGHRMTPKGRPIIDPLLLTNGDSVLAKPNRKVKNAVKVFDAHGNVIADSGWEYLCRKEFENAGLVFDFKRSFGLLPTIKSEGLGTLRMRKWTPDFCFERHRIVADSKGHVTEMAKIKVHMFLFKYQDWSVFFLKNKSELFTFINYIKQIETE